jgi:hypothetical protein
MISRSGIPDRLASIERIVHGIAKSSDAIAIAAAMLCAKVLE